MSIEQKAREEAKAILGGLNCDDKELLCCNGFAGLSFQSAALHRLNTAGLVHIDVEKSSSGVVQRFKAHHTPLGLQVRALIEEQKV